jgi:predicted metal-dependent phosphoesterase TrpH
VIAVRVDYHFHTDHSYDGRSSAREVLEAATRAGLDVLCVTDHDTIEGAVRLAALAGPELRVVVGCEFTCDDGSHVIGLHLADFLEERRPLALVERIREQGGRVLVPHPFRRGSGLLRPELRRSPAFVRDVLARVDLVECFNGRDTFENNRRNRAFALEHGLASVAGSDGHEARELGAVFVEYGEGAVAEGGSPARVFFPTQPERREHPLKRAAMELYHRYERRLPEGVGQLYRAARRELKRDRPRWAEAGPRLQYELPPSPRELP